MILYNVRDVLSTTPLNVGWHHAVVMGYQNLFFSPPLPSAIHIWGRWPTYNFCPHCFPISPHRSLSTKKSILAYRKIFTPADSFFSSLTSSFFQVLEHSAPPLFLTGLHTISRYASERFPSFRMVSFSGFRNHHRPTTQTFLPQPRCRNAVITDVTDLVFFRNHFHQIYFSQYPFILFQHFFLFWNKIYVVSFPAAGDFDGLGRSKERRVNVHWE